MAGKDIFRKKRQSKNKLACQEAASKSQERLARLVNEPESKRRHRQLVKSKSLKQTLSIVNNSTMSSMAGRKMLDARSPPIFGQKMFFANKSLDKSFKRDIKAKRHKDCIKINRSMSIAAGGKLVPATFTDFGRKQSMTACKDKVLQESAKRTRPSGNLKSLSQSSKLGARQSKADHRFDSPARNRLPLIIQASDSHPEESSGLLEKQMADFKAKLSRFLTAHQIMQQMLLAK